MAVASFIATRSALMSRAAATLARDGQHEMAEAVALVLTGIDSLPEALGLAPGWRAALKFSARDDALARLVEHYGKGSALRLAEQICAIIARYHDSAAWPSDRHAGRRPKGVNGLCYDFLVASRPLKPETVRRHPLLAGNQDHRACQKALADSTHGPRIPPPPDDQQRHRRRA